MPQGDDPSAGFGPSTYGDAFASVYQEWYGSITDAEATAAMIDTHAPAGAIVELGSGDGRLAYPIAARGRMVIAVDASVPMLNRCATAAPFAPADTAGRVVELHGDLARLPLRAHPEVPIAGALCAFNTLFNLPSVSAQSALLFSVAQCLVPGGILIIEAITGEGLDQAPPESIGISRLTASQLVLSATVVDAEHQLMRGQHVDITEAGITLRPWQLRWSRPEEIDAMATRAGLHRQARYADWSGAPFTTESSTHITIYSR